uniref:Methyltransferase domain-containing protein n=1 Tax=Magnetococcus massalia (strain MO-1) TaxID=451514 RepID=A0A1S7LEE7_MAGMO|nr:protein of unknown function [Candidatus Magnetococcus massalia]
MQGSERFLTALDTHVKLIAKGARKTVAANQELADWMLEPLADWTVKAYGEETFESIAKAYFEYSMSVAKCQKDYEAAGRYTAGAVEEVKKEVYGKSGVMIPYMWAAVLIYAFWPSMVNHLRLFRHDFVEQLPKEARVAEMACGHGVLGLLTATDREDVTVDGLDISPSAIEMAQSLANVSACKDRVSLRVEDALVAPEKPGQFQGVIAAMLAEHLEQPEMMFANVSQLLAPGGIAYISTALESAQPDHVYEFHHESEPLLLAEKYGLRITRMVVDSGYGIPGGQFLPRALAMVVVKV